MEDCGLAGCSFFVELCILERDFGVVAAASCGDSDASILSYEAPRLLEDEVIVEGVADGVTEGLWVIRPSRASSLYFAQTLQCEALYYELGNFSPHTHSYTLGLSPLFMRLTNIYICFKMLKAFFNTLTTKTEIDR